MGLATNGWLLIPVGIVFAIVYYFLFVAMINKMNLPTPGRLDKEGGDVDEAIARLGMDDLAKEYIVKLGGKSNITAIDACITRIRLTVENSSIINDDDLKSLGASGVIRPSKKNMQLVVGTKADIIADAIKKQLK
jgi:PTS system N-acetylglucosamine-specific IIC component